MIIYFSFFFSFADSAYCNNHYFIILLLSIYSHVRTLFGNLSSSLRLEVDCKSHLGASFLNFMLYC
jgi:hypothetical protein